MTRSKYSFSLSCSEFKKFLFSSMTEETELPVPTFVPALWPFDRQLVPFRGRDQAFLSLENRWAVALHESQTMHAILPPPLYPNEEDHISQIRYVKIIS